jgi:mRNA-degrading endonuclease toxin of MazEF toxin-antitoxin module
MEAMRQYELWFVAAEVTSTIRNIAVEVALGRGEGLPAICVANCDNIRTVPRSALTKRIGQLSPRRHSEVKRALGRPCLGRTYRRRLRTL